MHAAITRGMHAGASVQCVHDQAGIIRQCRAAGRLGQGLRLEQRVFFKGFAVFLDLHLHAHLAHGIYVEAFLQKRAQFFDLSEVVAGQRQFRLFADEFGGVAQRRELFFHQLEDAVFRQCQQGIQLLAAERPSLAGSLHLDKAQFALFPRHDDIDIRLRPAVLRVFQIKRALLLHNARGNRRYLPDYRGVLDHSLTQQFFYGQYERHKASRDGGGARAAVGLQNVAIDVDRALSQPRQIAGRAQRTADQPADLHIPAIFFDTVPRLARGGHPGQHRVFGGQPAAPRSLQKWRHALLDGGRAQNAGFAGLDQGASRRHFRKMW